MHAKFSCGSGLGLFVDDLFGDLHVSSETTETICVVKTEPYSPLFRVVSGGDLSFSKQLSCSVFCSFLKQSYPFPKLLHSIR